MTGFALRHRWFIVSLWSIVLMASLAAVAWRLTAKGSIVDNSVGIWFQKDHPDLRVYEAFNRQFGQKEWGVLLLRAESIFDPQFLRDLSQISSRLERVPHVSKVVSLTNVRDSEADDAGALVYRRLYPAAGADTLLSAPQIEDFRAKLYRNPIFERAILRRSDPTTTVLLVQSDNFINTPEPYRIAMVDQIQRVLADYPRVRGYSLAGTSVINAELNRASQHDSVHFYILVTLFIVGATYLSLRNWRDLVIVLAVVTAGALPPMALLGALKIPYNMVTVMLPPILVTLSVCDVVHVINAFHAERQRLASAPAIVKAIDGIWVPCAWTSVVTAAGFLSLAASSVYPIWQMGVFAALGIGLAWLITMTFVPIALVWLWPRGRTGTESSDGAKPVGIYARRLLPLQLGSWRWLWLALAGVLSLSAYGILRLEVDTDYTKFFGSHMYVTRAYPELAKAGYGQSPVALMLRFPAGQTYASGDNFARLLRFEQQIRKDPALLKLMTFSDLLARADLAFNGEGAPERIASYGAEQLGQLQLLSEIGGNDDLRDFITEDKRTVQLVALTPYMSSKQLEAFKARIERAGAAAFTATVELKVTGTTVQWANMDREISHTQMYSLYIIAAVFVVLLPLIFKSFSLGLVGVVINSLPMVITFGLMGLCDIRINLATALLGGVAIGATVDSTIFFINRVRLGREQGLAWDEAVNQAVLIVGDGIIMTALILAGGFACLISSGFLPTSNFGGLVCVSIVVALFLDIMVNPIVLKLVRAEPAKTATGLLVLLIMALSSTAQAAPDGMKLFQEAYRRNSGYGDYKSSVTMILKDKSGSSLTRKMAFSNLEVPGDGSRVLVVFESPADVKGSTVLTATHATRDDEQWIYLPAFQRVRQISTANQAAAFMGSEFSYEDVNSIDIQVAKFSYSFLREEPMGGVACFVIERRPKYEHSAYSREIVWLDKVDYQVRRVDYFDRDNKPFKTLTMEGYDKYQERFLRARQMTMVNLQNGKSTVLRWEPYRFHSGVRAADFEVSGLKK